MIRKLILVLLLLLGSAHAAEPMVSPYRLLPAFSAPYRYQGAIERTDDDRPYARQIALAAHDTGLDPELVHAVIAVESAYQAVALSPKGAVGLMQLMPETAQLQGVSNPGEVAGNLRAGTRHLRGLMERFNFRLDLALAAYNAGEGAVRRYHDSIPPYPETRSYVPAVLARYRANRPEVAGTGAANLSSRNYLAGTRLSPVAR